MVDGEDSDNKKIDRQTFTNNLMKQKFFSMDEAINTFVNTRTVFIISNEYTKKSGSTGRYYTVFPTFKDFLDNRDKYAHCHEILLDHKNNKPNMAGRLVFDFDIKDVTVPDDFTTQVETTIVDVINKYFRDVDTTRFMYVWSTSPNILKVSKHLTVKNLYFDDWINFSKLFYNWFGLIWEKKYRWIKSLDLVDSQIARIKGSLRMVGSSKIGGQVLELDDPQFQLSDSLIRIYFKNQREAEQLVTKDNLLNPNDLEISSDGDAEATDSESFNHMSFKSDNHKQIEPIYKSKVYDVAFELLNELQPNVFEIGNISGNRLDLIRLKAHPCLLSNKCHENENAFLFINDNGTIYDIRFGCRRGRNCCPRKTVSIGNLTANKLMKVPNLDFEYLKAKTKSKANPNSKPGKKKKSGSKIVVV
jgi:hypothetical protein